MNPLVADADSLEAIIMDWNGVIGLQPGPQDWVELAGLAGWSADNAAAFQQRFWRARPAYDRGRTTDAEFWQALVTGPGPLSRDLLAALCKTETAMWMGTDPAVLEALGAIRTRGIPILLLSNAPHQIADAVDATEWRRTLITHALYSARLGVTKPQRAAYEAALDAAGRPAPARTLFVDDRADNCAAARQIGMRTLLYTNAP